MKRIQISSGDGNKKWVASKDPLVKDLLEINRLMTDTHYDEGGRRKPSTLKIRIGVDQCSVTISDEDAEASITTTADTFEDAMELLDDALKHGKVTWREWPDEFKKKNKKKS